MCSPEAAPTIIIVRFHRVESNVGAGLSPHLLRHYGRSLELKIESDGERIGETVARVPETPSSDNRACSYLEGTLARGTVEFGPSLTAGWGIHRILRNQPTCARKG